MTEPHLLDFVLEPGTGKALEVPAGHVLRIEQIDGGQCVDLNCYNLHDYKERLSVGRTRARHGIHPSQGSFLWSASPRERQLLYILKDTAGCNDTLFPGCSAHLYERLFGFAVHTNCNDIQGEAQREYGLTPDDVHDSFNLFMKTAVGADGIPRIQRQFTKAGDFVEFLAMIDVLAIPNICGDDVMMNSNFSLKPMRIAVRKASQAELDTVPKAKALPSQRTPADFRLSVIKADRELYRDPGYKPAFANTPIEFTDVDVVLDPDEAEMFEAVKRSDIYGHDEGAALRDVLFTWWEETFLTDPPPPGSGA